MISAFVALTIHLALVALLLADDSLSKSESVWLRALYWASFISNSIAAMVWAFNLGMLLI